MFYIDLYIEPSTYRRVQSSVVPKIGELIDIDLLNHYEVERIGYVIKSIQGDDVLVPEVYLKKR